ncbi:MAG: MGDG synthase family glycosyltransferase [Thermoguttaceae bacterium]
MSGILVLSARVGAGHMRAAQAIERAFADSEVSEPVHHIEVLDYTNRLFRRLYSKAYLDIVNNVPELFGWFYSQRDKRGKNDGLKLAFDKLNTGPFVKLLEQYQPEITVCTHPMPAEIISWLVGEGRLSTLQAVVVTDFDIHMQWLCPTRAHYFVAIDETRAHLEALGVPADEITVSGIPVDPVFSRPKDSDAMRRKHDLRHDATVILVSAGGFGVGQVEDVLASLLHLRRPAQLVAVCGENEDLKARLDQFAGSVDPASSIAVKIVGYTAEMDEYIAAADFVVGKPGGLTMSETLARGRVFVIVNPIPGQEERNSDHLLEEGAAIRCNNLPVLAYKIDRLLDDPRRLEAMRANIRRLARPRAAYDIVAKLQLLQAASQAPSVSPGSDEARTVEPMVSSSSRLGRPSE